MPATDLDELVAAARRCDAAAWAQLHRRFAGAVASVIAGYRLQEADAADAAATTWMRAFERLDRLREPERMGSWLRTIAARECLALLRRARVECALGGRAVDVPADVPGPELAALDAEARRAIGAAVATLDGRGRLLVELMVLRPDAGYAEISRATGMPVGSIGPTRGRALRRLRSDLELAGYAS